MVRASRGPGWDGCWGSQPDGMGSGEWDGMSKIRINILCVGCTLLWLVTLFCLTSQCP